MTQKNTVLAKRIISRLQFETQNAIQKMVFFAVWRFRNDFILRFKLNGVCPKDFHERNVENFCVTRNRSIFFEHVNLNSRKKLLFGQMNAISRLQRRKTLSRKMFLAVWRFKVPKRSLFGVEVSKNWCKPLSKCLRSEEFSPQRKMEKICCFC